MVREQFTLRAEARFGASAAGTTLAFLSRAMVCTPHLIGREGTWSRLRALLVSRAPLITLVGPPGVGKSALAECVVAHWAPRVTRFPVGSGQLDAALEALEGVRSDEILVFDDADLAAGELAAALRARTREQAQTRVVVTCRRPLGVGQESVVRVRPLGLDESGALFRRALGRRRRDALRVWDLLLGRLDGLPRHILRAAEALPQLEGGAEALLSTLTRPADALELLDLSASLATSWLAMHADLRQALGRLAVFAGPFDAAAAESVLGDRRLQLLGELSDHGLVLRRDKRWFVPAPFRAFATQRLAAGAEVEAARRRHASRFVALARRAARLRDQTVTSGIVGSREDLLAARESLLVGSANVARSADAMVDITEACTVAQRAAGQDPRPLWADVIPRVLPCAPAAAARALMARARLDLEAAHVASARRDVDAALRRAQAVGKGGDPTLEVRARVALAEVAFEQARFVEADQHVEAALELLTRRELGHDVDLFAAAHRVRGDIHAELGRHLHARASYDRARGYGAALNDPLGRARLTLSQGRLYLALGQVHVALCLFEGAQRAFVQLHEAPLAALADALMGEAQAREGTLSASETLMQVVGATGELRRRGAWLLFAEARLALSRMHLAAGRRQDAINTREEVRSLALSAGARRLASRAEGGRQGALLEVSDNPNASAV